MSFNSENEVYMLFGCIPIAKRKREGEYQQLKTVIPHACNRDRRRLTCDEINVIQNIVVLDSSTCEVKANLHTQLNHIVTSWRLRPKYREYKQTVAQVYTACMPFYEKIMLQIIPIIGDWKVSLQLEMQYYTSYSAVSTPKAHFTKLEDALLYYVMHMLHACNTYDAKNYSDLALWFYICKN